MHGGDRARVILVNQKLCVDAQATGRHNLLVQRWFRSPPPSRNYPTNQDRREGFEHPPPVFGCALPLPESQQCLSYKRILDHGENLGHQTRLTRHSWRSSWSRRRNRSCQCGKLSGDLIQAVVKLDQAGALTHLENKDSYVRLLFVEFTSAFTTIRPQTLVSKLTTLGLSSTLCNWVLDFLTERQQSMQIHDVSSSTITLSTGSPQGCVLSPFLFTLLTHDCSARHPSCLIVKFTDDTAVVGRIANNDESDYRQEVEHLEGWCTENNLCINVKKTKEMIVDFRRGRHLPPPLHIGGTAVEVVSSFRYLGMNIANDLTWSTNTSYLVRKAHQRLCFLRRLRRAGLGSSVLTSFYRCVVESVMCTCITVWHGNCSAAEKKALQRVVKAAQRTVGCSLSTTTDIYTSRCRKRASCIMKDSTHPAHTLFAPLPSGRRLWSIKSRTTRLRNSFFPEAVRLLNSGGPL
ncbi:putative RNA-directed DNA polymerase from transposon BS [Collichthys lucidus]|uniref:Putative RNA-directed DNA polymerase from transposon BS n=1 Tax=Collichthys lucidus TaxID=240159 RepID=A0A4U5TVC9_COLLU|nr:putative RNA-directed DNA polymerase from transposon BS [Collichthys lucidus]